MKKNIILITVQRWGRTEYYATDDAGSLKIAQKIRDEQKAAYGPDLMKRYVAWPAFSFRKSIWIGANPKGPWLADPNYRWTNKEWVDTIYESQEKNKIKISFGKVDTVPDLPGLIVDDSIKKQVLVLQ